MNVEGNCLRIHKNHWWKQKTHLQGRGRKALKYLKTQIFISKLKEKKKRNTQTQG